MTRGVWVIRDGKLIEKHLAPPLHQTFASAPSVIPDGMAPTLNHADGKTYDSKRAYEKAVRARGCVIVGNEQFQERTQTPVSDPGKAVSRAVKAALSGHWKSR
jgi:hypothetical protein